jgi:type II secretory pathway component PulK
MKSRMTTRQRAPHRRSGIALISAIVICALLAGLIASVMRLTSSQRRQGIRTWAALQADWLLEAAAYRFANVTRPEQTAADLAQSGQLDPWRIELNSPQGPCQAELRFELVEPNESANERRRLRLIAEIAPGARWQTRSERILTLALSELPATESGPSENAANREDQP